MREEDIPVLQLTREKCLGSTFALYGPTKSGKTIYTKHIMSLINSPVINQAIVVSPTEPSNREYKDCIPGPAIWHRIRAPEGALLGKKSPESPEGKMMFLRSIIQRQTMATGIYRDHNQIAKIKPIASKLPAGAQKELNDALRSLNELTKASITEVQNRNITRHRQVEILAAYSAQFDEMRCKIYKMYLNRNISALWFNPDISKEERETLYFMNINPNLLTVWDDCAAGLKPLFRKEEFREFFYQPRHMSLTNIFTFQDNTDLDKNLRKQPFYSILCNSEVARGFFENSPFSREERNLAMAMIPIIFATPFQKMVYVRDDPKKFYRIRIDKTPKFRFGSDLYWSLCTEVQNNDNQLDTNNPFFSRFNVAL